MELPPQAPTPVLHKRQWWNALIANPAGYLPEDAPVESLRLGLPSHEILPLGPDWMRGWLFTYFVLLIDASLGFKLHWGFTEPQPRVRSLRSLTRATRVVAGGSFFRSPGKRSAPGNQRSVSLRPRMRADHFRNFRRRVHCQKGII